MNTNEINIQVIIQRLKALDADGETIQHILKEIGMEWQMLRQLMLSMPLEQVEYLMEERKDLLGI
jgi:hypothetical protein